MNNKWIPINEIWNENGIFLQVLVYSKKRYIECACRWSDKIRSDSGADVTKKVTHYMHLPDPPEDNKPK